MCDTEDHRGLDFMRHPRLVLAIFVLSGAAGLMYEVVWSRQLVLVFGNTTQAVSTILTGFFGGMAIGSFIGGRIADRVRSPLRLYGVIEMALVGVVLATPVTFQLLHEVYRDAYPSLERSPGLVALLRFGLAILALAPATILMGATLPALTRSLSGGAHLSRAFGRLYAANTGGAIVGALAAGVVLIELLGLTGTLVIAAACSGSAGLVALWLARERIRAATPVAEGSESPGFRAIGGSAPRPTLALGLAFVSGLTSLGYQVLWTRLLSSGTGNSTYVFTLILATFLLGIALGALVFSAVRRRVGRSIGLIAIAQILAGALAMLGLTLVINRPETLAPAAALRSVKESIWPILVVVLPATVVMGFTFPASSALLGDDPQRRAASAGSLLAANTLGAIVATFAIPFVVIPRIGSPHAVALLALTNLATGLLLIVLAGAIPPVRRVLGSVVVLAVALAIVVVIAVPGALMDPSEVRIRASGAKVFDSTEDEIASVQAGRLGSRSRLWVAGTSMTALTVDAKLMPVLPLMLRPQSKSALVVAFGMGSAFRTALIAGLRADAVELVPSVPKEFGYFYPDASRVRANPNGRIIIADGRNYMDLTPERYDIIVTDPPPPIQSSGVSVISSLEYYRAGHARLKPGGVMMQWTPFGATVDELRAHLRTFHAVFPHVTIVFGPGRNGIYMLGSDAPMVFSGEAIRTVLAHPGVLKEISSAYDSSQRTVDGWATLILSLIWIADDQVDRFTGDGPMITDDHPLPEYFILRQFFGKRSGLATRAELLRLTGP